MNGPTQKILAVFGMKWGHHTIIARTGKWLEREAMRQEHAEGGEDPNELYNYRGIVSPQFFANRPSVFDRPGIYLWEGELDDIDLDSGFELIFKGEWRKLTLAELGRFHDGLPPWPDEKLTYHPLGVPHAEGATQ